MKCAAPVDMTTCERYLKPQSLVKLQNWTREQFIEISPTLHWCPNPKCHLLVYSLERCEVDCQCGESFCTGCAQKAHDPCPCDLAKKWNSLCNDEAVATERYLRMQCRECPNCHVKITKNASHHDCNHMKCKQCNHDFCWLCLQPYSIGRSHPTFYVCNVTQAENKAGLESKEEKERKELADMMSRAQQWMPRVHDAQRDRNFAKAHLVKLKAFETELNCSYAWLYRLIHKVADSQKCVEWCSVVLYFSQMGQRFNVLYRMYLDLEEKSQGTLHDMDAIFGDIEVFQAKVHNDGQWRSGIMMAEEKLDEQMDRLKRFLETNLTEILQDAPDESYPYWHCVSPGCDGKNDRKDSTGKATVLCVKCGGCRLHSNANCLAKGCVEAIFWNCTLCTYQNYVKRNGREVSLRIYIRLLLSHERLLIIL